MVYLDYSATTPVNEEVLDTYVKVCKDYIGNPNSLHKLGVEASNLIDESTNQIASLLNVKPSEIIAYQMFFTININQQLSIFIFSIILNNKI